MQLIFSFFLDILLLLFFANLQVARSSSLTPPHSATHKDSSSVAALAKSEFLHTTAAVAPSSSSISAMGSTSAHEIDFGPVRFNSEQVPINTNSQENGILN